MADYLRGHAIEKQNGEWVYCDNKERTVNNERDCGHCGLSNTEHGHDGCIGTMIGVMNACCGHGQNNEAYVQYTNGLIVKGNAALKIINKHKQREGGIKSLQSDC